MPDAVKPVPVPLKELALAAFQLNIDDWPEFILVGLAVREAAFTVILVLAATALGDCFAYAVNENNVADKVMNNALMTMISFDNNEIIGISNCNSNHQIFPLIQTIKYFYC